MSGGKGTMALRDWSETLALGAIIAVFAALSPHFLGARNLSMLAIELSTTAILALGMLLVMLPGHIDLSAGSGVGSAGGAGVAEAPTPAPGANHAAAAKATPKAKTPETPRSAESIECSKQEDAKSLHGKPRKTCRANCMKELKKKA